MRQLFFRALFDYKKRPYNEMWDAIDESLNIIYPEEIKGWSFGTKKVKRDDIYKKYQLNFGSAFSDKFRISIGSDGSRYFSDIIITMHEHNVEFIDSIMRKFCQWPEIIYGYATDLDFNTWQNAATPYSYIMANKPHEHIPRLRGQELGKDIWNERLDLSSNPGRTVFHTGYVESIGGVMYVRDKLTTLTQGNLPELRDLPFLKIDDWGTCLRLELDPDLLAHAENDANLCSHMDVVRAILFPQKNASQMNP
jgi:hypothetical protein